MWSDDIRSTLIYTLLWLVVASQCASTTDKCTLDIFASGTTGLAAISYAAEHAGLYLQNDLGPIAAIAQSAQQATACTDEITKGSKLPNKAYPSEPEPLPEFYDHIVGAKSTDIPNHLFIAIATEAHVNGRKIRLYTHASVTVCMKSVTYPDGRKACSHRTLVVCDGVLPSLLLTKGNITVENLIRENGTCFPLYQEVYLGHEKTWVNVMPYDIKQKSFPTKHTSTIKVAPKNYFSKQVTGLDLDTLALADPQTASKIPQCKENTVMRHQVEANLGFPIPRKAIWNATYAPAPERDELTLQTLAAGCSFAGVPTERRQECDTVSVNTGTRAMQTGRLCLDYTSNISRDFLYALPVLYIANAISIQTVESLPSQVAVMESSGAIFHPATSISELLLASVACIFALVCSKRAELAKVSLNISRRTHVRYKAVSFAVCIAVSLLASSSALSIIIANISASRFRPLYTNGSMQNVNQTYISLDITLVSQLEYHYLPRNYIASIAVSSVLLSSSALWAVYRCFTMGTAAPGVQPT